MLNIPPQKYISSIALLVGYTTEIVLGARLILNIRETYYRDAACGSEWKHVGLHFREAGAGVFGEES